VISLQVDGLQQATARVRNMPRQVRFAASRALNDVAYEARTQVQNWMMDHFTGRGGEIPTEWVLRSISVGQAKPDRLEATVYPREMGGKSVDPSNVLNPEVHGGMRKAKRAEVTLRRIGMLRPDEYTVPGAGAPLDVHGNIPGAFWVHLLSYFQAFGEQGYRANMTAKTKARWAARGRNERGFRSINGVEYFVSYGKSTAEVTYGTGGRIVLGKNQHLRAGIWARSGTHGSTIKPIVMFVRAPRYSPRFPIRQVVDTTVAELLPARFAARMSDALATAR
jgi:hypothetical protein